MTGPKVFAAILAAKGLRTSAFGWLSVVLALHLSLAGFSTVAIAAIFTATMIEDALLTSLLSIVAARLGPRRIMQLASPLMTVGGLLLATSCRPGILVIGAVVGTLSLNGQGAGPFLPLEQALVAEHVPVSQPKIELGESVPRVVVRQSTSLLPVSHQEHANRRCRYEALGDQAVRERIAQPLYILSGEPCRR